MDSDDKEIIAVRIKDGVFVGNMAAAKDVVFIALNKITHIISCVGNELSDLYDGEADIAYLTLPWKSISGSMGGGTPMFDPADDLMHRVMDFVDTAIEAGTCCMVYCVRGVSRAPALVAAYFIIKYHWKLESALSFLEMAHPDTNIAAAAMRQLRLFATRHPAPRDIFDVREDDERRQNIDMEQWVLRNTLLNALEFPEQQRHRLFQRCVAEMDAAGHRRADARAGCARRAAGGGGSDANEPKLRFSDTRQGTRVSSQLSSPVVNPTAAIPRVTTVPPLPAVAALVETPILSRSSAASTCFTPSANENSEVSSECNSRLNESAGAALTRSLCNMSFVGARGVTALRSASASTSVSAGVPNRSSAVSLRHVDTSASSFSLIWSPSSAGVRTEAKTAVFTREVAVECMKEAVFRAKVREEESVKESNYCNSKCSDNHTSNTTNNGSSNITNNVSSNRNNVIAQSNTTRKNSNNSCGGGGNTNINYSHSAGGSSTESPRESVSQPPVVTRVRRRAATQPLSSNHDKRIAPTRVPISTLRSPFAVLSSTQTPRRRNGSPMPDVTVSIRSSAGSAIRSSRIRTNSIPRSTAASSVASSSSSLSPSSSSAHSAGSNAPGLLRVAPRTSSRTRTGSPSSNDKNSNNIDSNKAVASAAGHVSNAMSRSIARSASSAMCAFTSPTISATSNPSHNSHISTRSVSTGALPRSASTIAHSSSSSGTGGGGVMPSRAGTNWSAPRVASSASSPSVMAEHVAHPTLFTRSIMRVNSPDGNSLHRGSALASSTASNSMHSSLSAPRSASARAASRSPSSRDAADTRAAATAALSRPLKAVLSLSSTAVGVVRRQPPRAISAQRQ